MNHVASTNAFERDSFSLRFGTWSVLLHALFFVLVSFVHFSLDVEKPPPTVKVTFVEIPPAPEPEPVPEPEAPALLQPQRRMQPQPVQRKQLQSTPKPLDISQPVEMPRIVSAVPPPQQPPTQPVKRRLLQDSRATDTLQARNLTKTTTRTTRTTAKTKAAEPPSLFVPGFSTVAALEGAANRHVVRTSLPSTPSRASRRTLQATTGGEAQTQTSVGVLGPPIRPVYPLIAKRSGWEGTVLVRVTVETNGRASKVVVSRSSGHKVLDDAAVKAIKRRTFRPARDGNIPIRSIVVIPLKFVLKKHG